jgi:beta-1,4-mannosyltransferase
MPDWQRTIWNGFYCRGLSLVSDGFLTLSPSTVERVRMQIPDLKGVVGSFVWHPTYSLFCSMFGSRQSASPQATACNFGFVGLIRPYKGVDELLQAFNLLKGEKFALRLAGLPLDEELGKFVAESARHDARINVDLRHIDDDDMLSIVSSCDVVVLPFKNYLHSGSLVYALSAGSRVLTPDAPFARDMQARFGSRWIMLYEPPLTATVLSDAARWAKARPPAGCPRIELRETGTELLRFCQSILTHVEGGL